MIGFKLNKILFCCAIVAVSTFLMPNVALGFSGAGLGSENYPYRITDCDELQEIGDELDAYYVLLNDIDCVDSTTWNEGDGYYPPQNFTGDFDGRNNTIDNLFSAYAGVDGGLFGSVNGGTVRNIHLTSADFTFTSKYSGGIVGRCNNGCTISGSSFNGSLVGQSYVGGLAGSIENSTVYQSWSTGDVDGNAGYPGGFVGLLSSSDVYDCYTTADVVNGGRSGGFASRIFTNGADTEVNISRVYAAGSLFAPNYRASFSGQFESYSGGGDISISDVISATIYDTNTLDNLTAFSGGSYKAPIYSNVVYDNTRANNDTYDNECDSYGADAECTDVDYTTLFNTSAAAPFNDGEQIWDFDTVWQVEADGLPTLRETTLADLNPLGAPDVPDELIAQSIIYDSATLVWAEPLNGGADITNYLIEFKEADELDWESIDTESTDFFYDIDGLTEDTDYEFRVAAVNENGTSDFSEIFEFSTLAPTAISSCDELQDISDADLSFARFFLSQDIDCSMTNPDDSEWDEEGTWGEGIGFYPIGDEVDFFDGSFDGRGYTVSGLFINATDIHVGLFGFLGANAEVSNIFLEDVDITSTLSEEEEGFYSTGSLAGYNEGIVSRASTKGNVTAGCCEIGGLVGTNEGLIMESYADVEVSGDVPVGGLVGYNNEGSIENSFARGNVTAFDYLAGGLVGADSAGLVINSYALGIPDAPEDPESIGGLIGSCCENTEVVNSFWNVDTSGLSEEEDNGYGDPKTSTEMRAIATFTSDLEEPWDFDDIWSIDPDENDGFPYLVALGAPYIEVIASNNRSSTGSRNSTGSRISGAWAENSSEISDYDKEVQRVMDDKIVIETPAAEANKCEALMIFSRVFKWEVPSTETTVYTDVPDWCVSLAVFGTDRGIVEGRTATTLGLESPVTRFEVAVMVYRELKQQSYLLEGIGSKVFTDEIVAWAEEAVFALTKEGILKGFADSSFGGELGILKQDLGVILLRVKDKL